MSPRQLTALLHSRGFAIGCALLLLIALLQASAAGVVEPLTGERGFGLMSPNLWLAGSPAASLWVNFLLTFGIGVATVAMLKAFNMMRSQTALWAALFFVMQGATPDVGAQFGGGTLLCLAMLGASALLFSTYGDRWLTRRVFLAAALLSALAFVQYAFIFYLPVLVLGLVQMRIFNLRSVIAAAVGIVTPPWILLGCGIVDIDTLRWPDFAGTFSQRGSVEIIVMLATLGITLFLAVGALLANTVKLLSYTAKFRAENGFFTLVLLVTAILLVVDYNDLSAYVPLLNLMGAYQMAHLLANNRHRNSYIVGLSVIGLYIAAYIVSIVV